MARLLVGKSALTSLISMGKTSPIIIASNPLYQTFQRTSEKGEREY